MDLDSNKYVRMLCRRGFLVAVKELESKEGVYSLEGWNETRAGHMDSGAYCSSRELVVQADGDFQNPDAFHLAADVEIRRKPLDLKGRLAPPFRSWPGLSADLQLNYYEE